MKEQAEEAVTLGISRSQVRRRLRPTLLAPALGNGFLRQSSDLVRRQTTPESV